MKITRKLKWISSDKKNEDQISELEKNLVDFYANNPTYYQEINFTENNWVSDAEPGYARIVELTKQAGSICEIGCGSSNILKFYPQLQSKYVGVDFSDKQMKENSEKYPQAKFISFEKANVFPLESAKFDLVFCVFVLEHVTRPKEFLTECNRILKQDGKLVILCPNFLGTGRLSSQRSGFSQGTSKQKIDSRLFFDAIVTLLDNRLKIPFYCFLLRKLSFLRKGFLINVQPTVFTDSFIPDVDAIYVTYDKEIRKYLNTKMKYMENDFHLKLYEKLKKVLFLEFSKI